ncbi:MAG: iron-containing alcohol dehydrogenase [Spirochaetaceae bacterium]|nr:iron-containing alcohol dehydrogenase [Spirochaetaceae bacterium]
MDSFSYYLPTRLIFGPGKLAELATTSYFPWNKALLVIGSGGAMRRSGTLAQVQSLLASRGVVTIVYDKVKSNPEVTQVEEAARIAREEECDVVVGLGGGSTIDSAKSIAMLAKNPGHYWDYIMSGTGGRQIPGNGALPIVAITTTAGTGTEADPWTVQSNPQTREKIGWGTDCTYPALSIIDPELMVSLPPKQTAYTGMDALFHSVEGYLATCHQPASDLFALDAVSRVAKWLPTAVADGSNIEARTELAWANTEAGIVESLSSCISHHSLEHALSAFYPAVAHGCGLTMLSVAYFRDVAERNPERFADLAKAMGENVDALPGSERPFAFIKALENLIVAVGLADEKFSAYGVKKSDIPAMARNAFFAMGHLFAVTPVKQEQADVERIFERAYT